MRRLMILAAALVVGACGGGSGDQAPEAAAEGGETFTVELSAYDFGYELTDEPIPAGEIETVMRNDGKEPHQALLYRLNDGVDFETFKTKVMKDDSLIPQLATGGTDGISEVAAAGEEISSTGDELDPGTYAYICFVRDQKTAKNHAELGMIAPMVVR